MLQKYGGLWYHGKAFMGPGQATEARVYKWKVGNRWPDHIGDEVIDPKTYDVHGGWFIAGNLNKYTSNTVNVQNMLLMAYEMAMVKGGPKDNDLNIPESGNKIPDELDEIRVGTEFLIRDNDGSGAAFGRVHQESGSPPETVTLPVQLTMPNSEVTMGRAAALAYAAAVWSESKFDNAFATKCLNEAMRSWKLLQLKPHPWPVDPKNPNKSSAKAKCAATTTIQPGAPSRPPPCSASRARKNSTKSCMPISPTATWSGTPLIRVVDLDPQQRRRPGPRRQNHESDARRRRFHPESAQRQKLPHFHAGLLVGQHPNHRWSRHHAGTRLLITNNAAKKQAYLNGAENYIHYLYGRNPRGECYSPT